MSFRTDGPPIMACGLADGNVVVWDLEKQTIASTRKRQRCLCVLFALTLCGFFLFASRRQGTLRTSASVSRLCFLPGEPLLVTAGGNSLKVWIFDMPDGAHCVSLVSLLRRFVLCSCAAFPFANALCFHVAGAGRLLRSREGHCAPPTVLRFLDDGHALVTCGPDAVRLLSVRRCRFIFFHNSGCVLLCPRIAKTDVTPPPYFFLYS